MTLVSNLHEFPTAAPTLRDTAWAMATLGYTPDRRCAFWSFVHANHVPHVRLGARLIKFNERQLLDWIERRNSQPRRR